MSESDSPVSQLLERSESLFAGKRLLIAGAIEDTYPLQLAKLAAEACLFTSDYSRYRQLRAVAGNVEIQFGHQFQSERRFDALLLLLPKAKAEAQYLLASLSPSLEPGAELFLAGDNRGGINGAPKLLAPYADQTQKLDSARRCSLYHARLSQPVLPFQLEQWVTTYPLVLPGIQLEIQALPGVFSAGELDQGTRLLLEHLPPLAGRVLDIGCGAGVIGAVLKLRQPDLQVEMIDINALALESARRTLRHNGLDARVFASDVYSDVTPGLDHIVTNPPFHAGLKTHYAPTEQLMLQAPRYLSSQGQLWLVANAFLKYEPFLAQAFSQLQRLAQNNKFILYRAT